MKKIQEHEWKKMHEEMVAQMIEHETKAAQKRKGRHLTDEETQRIHMFANAAAGAEISRAQLRHECDLR